MRRMKHAARVIGVIVVAVLTALAVTVLCAPGETRAELAELIKGVDEQEEPSRQIDWDSLPEEVVAWIEVPGTNIDEEFAREHSRIIIYKRSGATLELDVCAVDIVNANREKLVIDQENDFKQIVEAADFWLSDFDEAAFVQAWHDIAT